MKNLMGKSFNLRDLVRSSWESDRSSGDLLPEDTTLFFGSPQPSHSYRRRVQEMAKKDPSWAEFALPIF